MLNPWLRLPKVGPFVLPEDAPFVEEFNSVQGRHSEHFLDLRLPPNPFSGLHDAPVVILLANPGIGDSDLRVQRKQENLNLLHDAIKTPGGTPFIWLSDVGQHLSPEQWWQSRTRDLKKIVGSDEELATKLLLVELHGYHSKSWSAPLRNFPSQAYGFELVQDAMKRNATIIAARCQEYWFASIPGLRKYKRLVPKLNSPRSAYLSKSNLGDEGFALVEQALKRHKK